MEILEILALIFSSNLLMVMVTSILNRRKNWAETSKSFAEIEKLRSEIEENEKSNRAEIEDKVFTRASILIDKQRVEIDAYRSVADSLNTRIERLQEHLAKEADRHTKETDRLEEKIINLEKCVELYRQQANRRKEENESLMDEVGRLRTSVRGLR